ncbi:hypothetical protein GF389_06260 [Candidatus Dojkabacteria bacterium]|nr:hypothetical protein [Candidatus Dojkabacteria bacterium]
MCDIGVERSTYPQRAAILDPRLYPSMQGIQYTKHDLRDLAKKLPGIQEHEHYSLLSSLRYLLNPGFNSQDEGIGRIYFVPQKPVVIKHLVNSLNNSNAHFQLKIWHEIAADQCVLYFDGTLADGANTENVVTALREVYGRYEDDFVKIKLPLASTILDDEENAMYGINFKQSNNNPDVTPNSALQKAIDNLEESYTYDSLCKEIAKKYPYDDANPAFVKDSDKFESIREQSIPNTYIPEID